MMDEVKDIKTMRPVPIKLQEYVQQLLIDGSTTEKEKQTKIEILGMITVMERNRACVHPKSFYQGRIMWEVKYPPGHVFQNGPKYPGAWGAMVRNYTLNKKFSKILGTGGDGSLVLDVQKIMDKSVDIQRKAKDMAQGIGGLDLQYLKTLKGEGE